MDMLLLCFFVISWERVSVNSEVWPQGTYGLPKPVSGCPENWQEGWRLQDMENNNPKSILSSRLKLFMDVNLTDAGDIERAFCIKASNYDGAAKPWPAGSYCIYKKNNCPSGMQDGYIKWDDEDDPPNKNLRRGVLPDGIYNSDTKIEYCCQGQGSWYKHIELPVDRPFYLLPHTTKNCQRVIGALSTIQYITYDTEEMHNIDIFASSHVYTDKTVGLPTIYYCHYQGCKHHLRNQSGVISVANFPSFQHCSWTITVDKGFVVFFTFVSVNIRLGEQNKIDIYDGINNNAPFLARYCGNNATSRITLTSTGNTMFIVFTSGDNRGYSGTLDFEATYQSTISSGVSWPSGTYGLPKPSSTLCPDRWLHGWRRQMMEDDWGQIGSSFSPEFHMDANLNGHAITRHFCVKTKNNGLDSKVWPAGRYCIYKKNHCPSGMKAGYIQWDDEDTPSHSLRNQKYGTLPDGDYGDFKTVIYFCCQDNREWSESIELPLNEPFYLLPYKSKNCQRVKWALSSLEWITYDTEKVNNYDKFDRSHAYGERHGGVLVVYYCYYQSCQYKLDNNNGSFGVDNYSPFQYCSWNITVHESSVVFVEFTSLQIPDCSENQIMVLDGKDLTASILAVYCGENASYAGNTLRSTGNSMFIVLKSGSSHSLRFRASYKGVKPRTEPSWPSGRYGLPKPKSGCPENWVQGWRKQEMESDSFSQSSFSRHFHMDAKLSLQLHGGNTIERKFCVKTINQEQPRRDWPKGSYCIYKKYPCPSGMSDGYIRWDDEDDTNINDKAGILPDGNYNTDTEIYYCCQNGGSWYDTMELPFSQPFFLLPYSSKNCQRVNWTVSTLENIIYDTEDTANNDRLSGHHVYIEGQDSLRTIYYCYYEGCQHKINADTPSQISVSSSTTKDFRYCSWLLSATRGFINVTFSSIRAPDDCRENFIEVYDGPNSQSRLITRFCRLTPSFSFYNVASTGSDLFVLVKSGHDGRMGITVSFSAFFNNVLTSSTVPPLTTRTRTQKSTLVLQPLTTASTITLSSSPPATSTHPWSTTSPSTTNINSEKTTKTLKTSSFTSSASLPAPLPSQPLSLTTSVTLQSSASSPETITTEVPSSKEPATTAVESNPSPGSIKNESDISESVAIAVPICVTVLAIAFMVLMFYWRRKSKDSNNSPSARTTHGESLNPSYEPSISVDPRKECVRYQVRDAVYSQEQVNPIYEASDDDLDDHTYWDIDDVQQYRSSASRNNYETPVDLSSQNQSDSNGNVIQRGQDEPLRASNPSYAKVGPSSAYACSPINTARENYKTARNPYENQVVLKDSKSSYDTPTHPPIVDSSRQQPPVIAIRGEGTPQYQTPGLTATAAQCDKMDGQNQYAIPKTAVTSSTC